ncbi:MAG: ABC transporter substrate-binding protein [Planctomycetota bacterium]|jgi:branched-chain amino acid transport system substrate-binding protein|nr:ABC transporter substrate-binding protein [Planctomycetota bacterium]
MKKVLAFLLAVAILHSVTIYSSAVAEDGEIPPIKIAMFLPMTGSLSAMGTYEDRAMKIIADHFNNTLGGVKSMGGAKFEIRVFDMQSDINLIKTVMERICNEYQPMAIVGGGSSAFVVPALSVNERYQIPFLTQCSGRQIQESGYQYSIALTAIADEIGNSQIKFLDWLVGEKNYSITKAAILNVDNDYGNGQANGARAVLKGSTYKLVYDQNFPAYITDASSLITSIKASGAEVLFLTAEPSQGPLIFDAMDALNYHPVIMGGGSAMAYPSFADALGDNVLGLCSIANSNRYITNVYQSEDFVNLYQKYEDTYNEGTAESFCNDVSVIQAIYECLEQNPTYDAVELTKNLRAGSWTTCWPSYPRADGTPGKMEFKENGGAKHSFFPIVQWQKHNGRYEMRAIWPPEILVGRNGYIDYNIINR